MIGLESWVWVSTAWDKPSSTINLNPHRCPKCAIESATAHLPSRSYDKEFRPCLRRIEAVEILERRILPPLPHQSIVQRFEVAILYYVLNSCAVRTTGDDSV
jgi:hypothetical protein